MSEENPELPVSNECVVKGGARDVVGTKWRVERGFRIIARCHTEAEANEIASKINAHDGLVAALQFCRSVIHRDGPLDLSEKIAVEKIDAAIAKTMTTV